MPAAYMLSDVAVSASTDPEAFGRVMAEAQAMGRPVVVADHGGAAEQVIDRVTGWCFEPGNPDAFADALETALSLDPEARAKLAVIAADHARTHYAKTGMCAATLRIYAGVFESHKS
jgi:glycosyltransferase involved in cell wall biosynthesis